MLVPQQPGKPLLHHTHTLHHTGPVYLDPQRQGIDEHAQRTVGTRSTLHATKQHRPEHDACMPRGTCHHLRPGQMEQTGRTDAQFACLAAQQHRQPIRQLETHFLHIRSIALHIDQTERRTGLIHITQQCAEISFVLLSAHAQQCLCHEITKRQWRRQACSLTAQVTSDLLQHNLQRGVIQRQVVTEQLQQPAPTGRIVCNKTTHQRRLTHIQAPMPRIETRLQQCRGIVSAVLHANLLDQQRRTTPYDLHRGGQPFPGHRRAQDIVTIDHTLQGFDKPVQTRTAVERDQVRL